jgi:iron complex transport system ATP-binding protein
MKISVKNIEFAYNGTPVLKNISFDVDKGHFLALAGPNGSGKSTLIKCLNGILKPQKGDVIINDHKIGNYRLRELAMNIAYVPQNRPAVYPMSVFDTVLLGRKPYIGWKPSDQDLEVTAEIISQMNLDDVAQRDVNKLSGGQQQAVYIARALAQQPDILLLDEPTSNLDLKHCFGIMEILKNLCSTGITVVVALHDINLAIRYSSHIIMLKSGEIFAGGSSSIVTEELLEILYEVKINRVEVNGIVQMIPVGSHPDKERNNE